MIDVSTLPNDIDALKKLIINQSEEILKTKSREKNHLQEIDRLKELINLLQRKKYAPQSEKFKNQLPLFNEVEDIFENEQEAEKTTIVPEHERKKRGKRKPLPESLPREDIVLDLSDEEKEGLKYIGDEITEKLEITPAKVTVKRYVRKKYAPVDDNKDFKIALLPPQLLPKTMASASLISYIIVSKYEDALPLYRQEKIFSRISADLTRQTMARWLIDVSKKLIPLYNLLEERLLDRKYLQMDETPTQVLKEKNKKATSKSYMWVRYSPGDNPIVLYDYDPTRKGEVPVRLLAGFKGYLQVDGYKGYDRVCKENKLLRLGCWDHCRRKFFEASKTSNGKGIGKKGLDKIKKLYKIEETIKNLLKEEKEKIREVESLPLLTSFKIWVDEIRQQITPDSVAGKAINYAYNEWASLIRYLEDGDLNISNSLVENSIRPFALGRKNWLFSASVDGANASAMYYSLIETAKSNDMDAFDYLKRMLDKLPSAQRVEDFEALLPLKGHFKG